MEEPTTKPTTIPKKKGILHKLLIWCVVCVVVLGAVLLVVVSTTPTNTATVVNTPQQATAEDIPKQAVVLLHNKAMQLYRAGQYQQAVPLFQQVLIIEEKEYGATHTEVAGTLNNLASALEETGRYDKAEPLLRRALAIREKSLGSDHPSTATSLNNLAGLLNTTGRYDKAEPLLRRALAIREKSLGSDHPDTATSLNNLATLLDTTGRYDKAEPLLRRALAIFEKAHGADHPLVATALHNLASVLEGTGRYDKAEPLYRRALAIYEKAHGANHPHVATALNNLAELLSTTGRYDKAEPLYRRILAIREKSLGSDHPDVAGSLNNLASLLSATGRYDKAEVLFRRALAITEKSLGSEHPSIATSLNNLAGVLSATGRYDKAEPLFRRALAITEKSLGSDHPSTATSLNNLAGVLSATGRYDKAEPLLRHALAINEKYLGTDHQYVARTLRNLASLLNKTNRPKQAEPLYLRAYRIASQAGVPELSWQVQSNLRKHYQNSNPLLAVFYGKQAINTLQAVRQQLTQAETTTQKSFAKKVRHNYEGLSDLLISQGRLAEAQQVLAMLKEEEYFDFNQRNAAADQRTTQASFNSFENPAEAQLQKAGKRLTQLGAEWRQLVKQQRHSPLSPAQQKRYNDLDKQLQQANAEFMRVVESIKASFTQFAASNTKRYSELSQKNLQNDLTDIIGQLGDDVVLLQYVVLPKVTHILLTTGEVRLARKVHIKQSDVYRMSNQLLQALKNPKQDPRAAAQQLYQQLIAPVEQDLQGMHAKTLMLSLDGALRYVPMAALHDGKQYLIERYALAIYNDAARDRLRDEPSSQWRINGLGVTKAHAGFSALSGVRKELHTIIATKNPTQGALSGNIRLDEQFNRQGLEQALRERLPVLHIASHFKFDPAGNHQSYLLLGDGSPLSLEDIRTNYRFRDVDLLTLSACETAVGTSSGVTAGREIEGLGVLAQQQGARGVLATLWKVADLSTAELMQQFYSQRQTSQLNKAEALRQAQLSMLHGATQTTAPSQQQRGQVEAASSSTAPTVAYKANAKAPYAHPYYWAPFILMGNWK